MKEESKLGSGNFRLSENKQEIDFLVVRDSISGFEVKTRYPGKPSVFNYFESQYPGCDLKVVAIDGKIDKGRDFLYPWEIL